MAPVSFDLDAAREAVAVDPYDDGPDLEPPVSLPDVPPDVEAGERFCPRCGERLFPDVVDEYEYGVGRVAVACGWARCERCAQDDALDRLRARAPWLFRAELVDDTDDCGHRYYALRQD
jgi:hypothetical protein